MHDQVDKEYLLNLVEALNEEVDQVIWGQFKIVEDEYIWGTYLAPSVEPQRKIRVSDEGNGRILVATAAYPSIWKFDKHFQPYPGECPHFECTFSNKRPLRPCANEIVRKVLSKWIEPWDAAKKKLQEIVDEYEKFLNIRRELCEIMGNGNRVPKDDDEREGVSPYAPEGIDGYYVEGAVRINGNVELKFRSLSLDEAKILLKALPNSKKKTSKKKA